MKALRGAVAVLALACLAVGLLPVAARLGQWLTTTDPDPEDSADQRAADAVLAAALDGDPDAALYIGYPDDDFPVDLAAEVERYLASLT